MRELSWSEAVKISQDALFEMEERRKDLAEREARPYIEDQPPPRTENTEDLPVIHELVIADIRDRLAVGTQRYGTPLKPFNGRDALIDAYQEALDLATYLRQCIEERRLADGNDR